MIASLLLAVAVAATVGARHTSPRPAAEAPPAQSLDIAPVWSGHPVGCALLTYGKRQLAAFYDADRRMTVAARSLDESGWRLVRLPSVLGWDSHNYVTMALDSGGQIHVSGNMHCRPLVYFRTERPGDVASFRQFPAMVGRNEERCTYPHFLHAPQGDLIFTYRDGRSGAGDQYCNVYDLRAATWRRLIDAPLFSGGGKMNAYFAGPEQDKSGVFHICWVWRNAPDCATNHDLCYARSKDLIRWETSAGRPLSLPITLATAEIVDPVPPSGGIVNGNTKIGFDARGRPIVSYHKFDAQGQTQLYSARREAGGWRIYQTSDWDYRWEFHGGGTIPFEINFGPVVAGPDGSLTQTWRHVKHGSGNWKLDPATLKPAGRAASRSGGLPKNFARVESTWPGMEVRTAADLGSGDDPKVRYLLRWETLPSNRDRPRPEPLPPPTMLRLYRVREQ